MVGRRHLRSRPGLDRGLTYKNVTVDPAGNLSFCPAEFWGTGVTRYRFDR
jgi:hypothetical protein